MVSRSFRNLVLSWSVPIETLIKVSQPLCFRDLMIVPCFIKSSAGPKDLHNGKGLDPIWCCMWRKIGHKIMHWLHSQPLLGGVMASTSWSRADATANGALIHTKCMGDCIGFLETPNFQDGA